MTVRKPVSRPRDPQVGMLGARPLPPRLDPRAGRPPRPSKAGGVRPGSSERRPAPPGATPAHARGRAHHHPALPAHGFGRTLGLTIVGTLLPGSAFVAAGYKKI